MADEEDPAFLEPDDLLALGMFVAANAQDLLAAVITYVAASPDGEEKERRSEVALALVGALQVNTMGWREEIERERARRATAS